MSIYDEITNTIIRHLETCEDNYEKAWDVFANVPKNVQSNKQYNGINRLFLSLIRSSKKYPSSTFGTFNQWKALGANVKKGEHGHKILFFSYLPKEIDGGKDIMIPCFKVFTVFNVAQVENYEHTETIEKDFFIDDVVASTGAKIVCGGNKSLYVPSLDEIHIPNINDFKSKDGYYTTLLHELSHWTSHPSRLNRNVADFFGDDAIAMEEMVAELGSAFLCGQLNISNEVRVDHSKFIKSWLKVLKNNNRAIFKAAELAQKAADYIIGE